MKARENHERRRLIGDGSAASPAQCGGLRVEQPDAARWRYWTTMALVLVSFFGAIQARAQDILDSTFVPPLVDSYWSSSTHVEAAALQPDGKILIGGALYQRGTFLVQGLQRLNEDGSPDPSFTPAGTSVGQAGGSVSAILVQPDGKILVAGSMTIINGQAANLIARLNPDGSLDTGFAPHVAGVAVAGMALQPDGKIVIAGSFTAIDNAAIKVIGRLNSDGSADSSFSSPLQSSDATVIALRADGKILLGGSNLAYADASGNTVSASLLRLKPNGSVDTDLTAVSGFTAALGPSAIAATPDRRVLVSGSNPDGWTIRRINADDTPDNSFANLLYADVAGFQCGCIMSISVQPNGRIVVGGIFNTVGGATHFNIVRLDPDGSIDPTFDPSGRGAMGDFQMFTTYATFNTVSAQSDGKIIVAGNFTMIGDAQVPRYGIARLLVPEFAAQRLGYGNSQGSVQWRRAGSGAEFQRATFESSPDGSAWTGLGEGVWNAGTWSLGGLDLPGNGPLWLRARGFGSVSGTNGFSGSLLESVQQLVATVTPSAGAGGGIAPSVPQYIAAGSSAGFVVTPDPGQQVFGIGGTCGGALNGNAFSTRAVASDCTVEASFTAAANNVVRPAATSGGTITPDAPSIVATGGTASFTVTADPHYTLAGVSGCGGALSGSVYTTAAVNASCVVNAVFAADTFTVTPNGGSGGDVVPNAPQTVAYGDALSLTLTPAAFHHVHVAGTCGGSLDLSGTIYTTNPVTANCSVEVSFPSVVFTVTPTFGLNGQIAPSVPQTIDGGMSAAFTVTPNAGYAATVAGTCGGTLQGTTYTTNPVSADCSVIASFAPEVYTVTPSAGPHGTITPNTPQNAAFGDILTFALAADSGYAASVTGTCGGSLSGNVFITAQIAENCTVIASFGVSADVIFRNGFEAATP